MKTIEVMMVRIYITEGSKLLDSIFDYLINQANVRGVSVFRAIEGFGETGIHATRLFYPSLNLPISIEFFDLPDKVNNTLEHLSTLIKPEHIVTWNAYANQA